jgi:cobalt-zinc-cadmium efflux system outer membrane protein
VSQEFVRGGKLQLNRSVAAKDVAVAELELAVRRRRLETEVRIAFYTALIAQKQRSVVDEIVDVARQGLQAAQDRAQDTAVGENDTLEARIELRTAEIEARSSLNRQLAAWRTLTAVVGNCNLPHHELDGELTLPATERDWNTSLAILESSSPEMAVVLTKRDRAQVALRRAKAEKVPNVTVDALLNVRDNGIGGDADGGLQVSLPLPLWNRNQGAVAQADSQLVMAQQDINSLRLDLQNRLAAVFERYSNAYYQVRLYRDEILPAAKRALELTRRNYTRGEAIYDDLLTSQRTFSAANLTYLGALLEVWVAEAELDGLLLVDATRDN